MNIRWYPTTWWSIIYSRNSSPFMELKVSLSCPQKPTTGPNPEPYEPSTYLHVLFI